MTTAVGQHYSTENEFNQLRVALSEMDTLMWSIQGEAEFDATWTVGDVRNMIAAMRRAYRENTGQNWQDNRAKAS